MNAYPPKENSSASGNLTGERRREKALREFKEVLRDLVLMLRDASGMQTVYLYWINRERRQFVLETKSTVIPEVVFQDRIGFDQHFLDEYKDIRRPVALQVDKDVDARELSHYYSETPVRHLTLLPFINNEETVALTVVESADAELDPDKREIIESYIKALGNVLSTYLEISDLYENQNEWVEYEQSLHFLNKKVHFAGLLQDMLDTMEGFLKQGGVSLISSGMGRWTNILNSTGAHQPIPLGLAVEKRSVAKDALDSGEPEFAIHFNRNPKRLSPRELNTEGATLAIPVLFNEFRKGVVVAYEENPLVFKESTKHKLINTVRLTALKIQAKLQSRDADTALLSNQYEAFIPDIWERVINTQIQRLNNGEVSYHSWVGMVTLAELSQIRTQLRLEELNLMQKDLVRTINPGQFGIPGFVGFHSDYIYTVFLQSKDSDAVSHWMDEIREKFRTPFELTNGKQIRSDLRIGMEELDASSGDAYQVVSKIKRALSRGINANENY